MDDADDMGEFWRGVKEQSQQKRATNREDSAQMLKAAGVEFQDHNLGAHLIVTAPNTLVDFWPGTGLWTPRSTKKSKRGVRSLIAFCRKGN